jgi:hypothetical protein
MAPATLRKLFRSWPSTTRPARLVEGEIRAPATLVDATSYATADAGSIPAVSTSVPESPAKAGLSSFTVLLDLRRTVRAPPACHATCAAGLHLRGESKTISHLHPGGRGWPPGDPKGGLYAFRATD